MGALNRHKGEIVGIAIREPETGLASQFTAWRVKSYTVLFHRLTRQV